MLNQKGSVSSLVPLVFIVGGLIAALVLVQQKQIFRPKAYSGSSGSLNQSDCRDNPVLPPGDAYKWAADCNKSCQVNEDCPEANSHGVSGSNTKWCFRFNNATVLRCLKLVLNENVNGRVVKAGVYQTGYDITTSAGFKARWGSNEGGVSYAVFSGVGDGQGGTDKAIITVSLNNPDPGYTCKWFYHADPDNPGGPTATQGSGCSARIKVGSGKWTPYQSHLWFELIPQDSVKSCTPGVWDRSSCSRCYPDGTTGPEGRDWGNSDSDKAGWCSCAKKYNPLVKIYTDNQVNSICASGTPASMVTLTTTPSPDVIVPLATTSPSGSPKFSCAQVITYAVDPGLISCVTYSTPCDMPSNFIKVDKCDEVRFCGGVNNVQCPAGDICYKFGSQIGTCQPRQKSWLDWLGILK